MSLGGVPLLAPYALDHQARLLDVVVDLADLFLLDAVNLL